MRQLGDIYESARISIPLRTFPDRDSLPPWGELDPRVRSELDVLQERIFSALGSDQLLLANHHRVINEFNRGVRQGVLAEPGAASVRSGGELSRSPFDWGRLLGLNANERGPEGMPLIKQFITVTHLLAYEFRQLNLAYSRPVDFLMRNIGPERADEFGELVFAMPVLLNYHRALVVRIVNEPGFSFAAYHGVQSPQPSHLEYLSQGVVALFDPRPKSWTRVAANLGLATLPFNDGATLQSEHFAAPGQIAELAAAKPIAAQTVVRRQMDRIELARNWVGSSVATIEFEQQERAPTTLWDVYQETQAATIRGQSTYFADVIANNVISLLSRWVENSLAPDDSRLGYLRRHLPAFTRGFDARSDRVVDLRDFPSVQFGRNLSDGLRRFEHGGLYVGGVSSALAELGETVNELYHAVDNFSSFVRNGLFSNEETELTELLLNLFDTYPVLTEELFGENTQFEFFSRTTIETRSSFDLMRSVLFHVVQAMQPANQERDTVLALLENARSLLQRLIALGDTCAAPRKAKPGGERLYYVADTPRTPSRTDQQQDAIVVAARHFEREFDTLTRVIRRLVQPLHMARMLRRTQASFGSDYMMGLGRRGVS
ncbi:MAG: hypothetical protein ACI9DC_001297 [Gammaproteobacteria bacterium]|jgi:hypothetical protein